MPKEEVPNPLVGKSFFQQKSHQWVIKILLILQNLKKMKSETLTNQQVNTIRTFIINNWIYQSYLNQLNEVLWEFVISQILLKAPNCKVSDHWIRIVTVKQLHGLFRLYCGPVFKKTIHLCNFIPGIPFHCQENLWQGFWNIYTILPRVENTITVLNKLLDKLKI